MRLGTRLNGLLRIHLNLSWLVVFLDIHALIFVYFMVDLIMVLFGLICVVILIMKLICVPIIHAMFSLTLHLPWTILMLS